MPLTKTSITDLIGTQASPITTTAGSTQSGQIDCNGANVYHEVTVHIEVAFGASPDADAVVEVFNYNPDNAEADTEVMTAFVITAATSTTKRVSISVPVQSIDTIQVSVTNQDTTDSVDVWVSYTGGYF